MIEISTATAILAGIKTATDIAKSLTGSGAKLDESSVKLSMADMMTSLAEAKIAVIDLQEEMQAKDKEIAALREDLRLKATVIRKGDAYYEIDDDGNATGDPYCQTCYESTGQLLHLAHTHPGIPGYQGNYYCQICKNTFRITKHQ
ncbi:MAG: hypothetical protein HQ568_08855 [Calditrichaeota bacterium]|nr:hypothetical protein [Calditrichota bacterium]